MKTLFAATAMCGAMLSASALPSAAQDINIYFQGDESRSHGPEARMHGRHNMHRERDQHHWGGRGERSAVGHRGGRHDRQGDYGHRMEKVLRLIESYNQDGDDRVTQAEIDEARAARLAEFDTDGDGSLSLQEYEALWLDAMRERMVDRFQTHDDDGDGLATVDEFSDRTSHLVLKMDRNGDGAISVDDVRRGSRDERDRETEPEN